MIRKGIMTTENTTPAATYAGRDAHIRYANRYAKVGQILSLTYEDGSVRKAKVLAVRPGQFITEVGVHVYSTPDLPRRRYALTGDIHNNLTDFTVTQIDLYR